MGQFIKTVDPAADADLLKQVVDAFFDDTDPYLVENGYPWGLFQYRFAKYLARVQKPDMPRDRKNDLAALKRGIKLA
jgi:hypothetical protein